MRDRVFGAGNRDWRWPLVEALVGFDLIFVGWLVAKPGGEEALVWFDDIALVVAPSLAALMAAVVAARNWPSRTGYAWGLIALGLFMVATGEVAWGVQELGMHGEVPFPSVADVGYLGIYPPVFLGLLLMPHAPVSGLKRVRLTMDALIAMTAIAIISWHLILADLISQSTDNVLAKSVSVAYPFADLGVVFAVLVLIGRSGRVASGVAMSCLAGGFAAMAFSDSLYTYLTSVKTYGSGNYIDVGWMLAYSLVTIAALIALTSRISLERSGDIEETPAIWPSLVSYAALIPLAAVHMVAFATRENKPSPLLEGGTLAVFALVIARQILTTYENVQLNRELAHLAGQLSGKLVTQRLELLHGRDPASSHSREAGAAEDLTPAGEVHAGGSQHHMPDSTRLDSFPWV
jgi:hypothetical protein